MVWALVLLILAIVGAHWFDYSRSVQEYTFAQPMSIDRHEDLRGVLTEKTPVVVEIGALPWRPEIAGGAVWPVQTEDGEHPASDWASKPTAVTNGAELAITMELETGLADLDQARAWWWVPGLREASVGLLQPEEVRGLSWVSAERQWIGCSHGGPLLLWLVHSRYHRYLSHNDGADPWTLTTATTPWIGRVQYIEVRIQPGWCIGLPTHWGWAVRNEGKEAAWWWRATQHSVFSWLLKDIQGAWNREDEPEESAGSSD